MVRYKNRYLVTEYAFTDTKTVNTISKNSLLNLIQDVVQQLHGDFGVGVVSYGLDIKYINFNTHIAIIRTRHGPHKLVASSLPFIRNTVLFKTLIVKATILKAFVFLRSYQLRQLEHFWKAKEKTKLNKKDEEFLEALKDFTYFNKAMMTF